MACARAGSPSSTYTLNVELSITSLLFTHFSLAWGLGSGLLVSYACDRFMISPQHWLRPDDAVRLCALCIDSPIAEVRRHRRWTLCLHTHSVQYRS